MRTLLFSLLYLHKIEAKDSIDNINNVCCLSEVMRMPIPTPLLNPNILPAQLKLKNRKKSNGINYLILIQEPPTNSVKEVKRIPVSSCASWRISIIYCILSTAPTL